MTGARADSNAAACVRPHDILELRSPHALDGIDEAPAWVRDSLSEAPFVTVRRARALPRTGADCREHAASSAGGPLRKSLPAAGRPLVAVGVRGAARHQRWACTVDARHVLRVLRPPDFLACMTGSDVRTINAVETLREQAAAECFSMRTLRQRQVPAQPLLPRAADSPHLPRTGSRAIAAPPRDVPALRELRALLARWRDIAYAWGPAGSVGFELATGVACVTPSSDLDIVLYSDRPMTRDEAARLHASLADSLTRVDVLIETPCGGFSLAEYATVPATASLLLRTADGPRLARDPWTPAPRVDSTWESTRAGGLNP